MQLPSLPLILFYAFVFLALYVLEVGYFRLARRYAIVDRPNRRSSHMGEVMRGGGVLFPVSCLLWVALVSAARHCEVLVSYAPFLAGLWLAAAVSFVDDIHSLTGKIRLIVHFVAMSLLFQSVGLWTMETWWMGAAALVVCVGATNVINFMDGINGNLVGLSLSSLLAVAMADMGVARGCVNTSFLVLMIIATLVFAVFNFRPNGHTRCFAGDVGSVSVAFIVLFCIGKIVERTGDPTYLVFLLVYGMEGCLTILHRVLLKENLSQAHRKHAFQLLVNELHIGHLKVATLYASVQLLISVGFLYAIPATPLAHWIYLLSAGAVLTAVYVGFMWRYYPLHEAYLASLEAKKSGQA